MKNLKQNITNTLKSFFAVSALATLLFANADDTEVFYSVNVSNNLLFVLDVSGSMKEKIVSTITTTADGSTSTGSGGGTAEEFDRTVAESRDDAIQRLEAVNVEAGPGDQNNVDEKLNFTPTNIVATRFRLGYDEIPRDATITNAYVTFTSEGVYADDTAITISIENAASEYAWANYQYPGYYSRTLYHDYYYDAVFPKIAERPEFGSVTWQPLSWDSQNQNGSRQQTEDLSALVQQVVSRSDWNKWNYYRNSLAFKFTTASGERVAYSRNSSSSQAPEIHIEYEYEERYRQWYRNHRGRWRWRWATRTVTDTYDGSVITGNDDAEQEWADGVAQTDQIYNGTEIVFNDQQVVAVRFDLNESPAKKIPKESVITKATIQFTSAGSYIDDALINVQIEDTGFAQDYDESNDKINSRSYDVASLKVWLPAAWLNSGDNGLAQQVDGLKDLVQHVVDRGDWDNALAFRFFNESGERIAFAQDSGSGVAPILHIEYQDINGATTGTTTSGGITTVTRVDTRLKFMQEALREVLETAPNFNVGLMKYSGMERDQRQGAGDDNLRHHYTGGVVFPISPIYETASEQIGVSDSTDNLPDPGASITVRDYIPNVADEWEPLGGTPIVDALYEAALYFRGEQMHYGKNKNNNEHKNSVGSHPSTYVGGAKITTPVWSVGRSSIADSNYISPIKDQCQSNYIVLMSDGKPTYYYDTGSWGAEKGPFARAIKGTTVNGLASAIPSCTRGNGEADNTGVELEAGTCGREITQYLANNDQSSSVDDVNAVKTFTIGFGHGLEDGAREYLESLVTVDDDPGTPEREGYYEADDKAKLKNAFQDIFQAVAEPAGTLAAPGYSVNVKNGLEHENDIYIPVFNRKNTSLWSGNLKKFRIVDDGNGKRKIQGKNNRNAVDELGGFEDDALDYWSKSATDDPDGNVVEKGGVASLLDPEARKLYSDLTCNGALDCALDTTANTLQASNTGASGQITNEILGIDGLGLSSTDANIKRKQLINFIRGWENGSYDSAQPEGSRGVARKHMGDMLHSEPLVVTYAEAGSEGGKKQYIFAATNEGYLHVFDTSDTSADAGKEIFAFMPKELLKNINPQFEKSGTARDHKYGIDGVLNFWHDKNNNKKYLYFGLRRGGHSYYALDVTSIDKPKLVWKAGASDGGRLVNMGQSWSPPYLAKVGVSGGGSKEVVIISGGYDKKEDRDIPNKPTYLNDSTVIDVGATEGQNIYIFDAKNGDLIWDLRGSTGDDQVGNSLPGGIRILDVNRNGLIDRMYFADTGGHVWRLDLSEKLSLTSDSESTLTLLADLAGTGVDARKFYNEPDVAVMRPNGKTIFAVSIGSGFRAHPKDKTIVDRFFVLKDESPYQALDQHYTAIDSDDLANVSINSQSGVIDSRVGDDENKDKGWFLTLPENGEKVLATALTFDGAITFTSMVPEILTSGVGIDACAAPATQGRLYALNILTGEAILDLDGDGSVDAEGSNDAFALISKGEIPGKVQQIFNSADKDDELDGEGKVIQTTCTHPVDLRVGKKLSQATGYDACRLESIYWNDPKDH